MIQVAQLSQRTARHGGLVVAKSGRLELGDTFYGLSIPSTTAQLNSTRRQVELSCALFRYKQGITCSPKHQ